MRRLSFLVLFLFSASLIGFGQGRSGSAAPSSSSSSSAASPHASGSSGGSVSSHSGGSSSASSHSSGGSSHSPGGGSNPRSSPGSPNHGSRASSSSSHSASSANRDRSKVPGSSRPSSENVKTKPEQPIATKVNAQAPTAKPHNWLSRLFRRRPPELAKAPKPCVVGKNCPSPPPKPCTGQKCPPPPPCGPGTVSNGRGGCVATHANDLCTINPQASGCPQSLV